MAAGDILGKQVHTENSCPRGLGRCEARQRSRELEVCSPWFGSSALFVLGVVWIEYTCSKSGGPTPPEYTSKPSYINFYGPLIVSARPARPLGTWSAGCQSTHARVCHRFLREWVVPSIERHAEMSKFHVALACRLVDPLQLRAITSLRP